jgi:N-acyl-D-aspartate/D-glutamate deacylase
VAYDLKIVGGRVIDGTGRDGFTADVAIRDGRIVAIGEAAQDAATTIDATGRVVSPGFVDIHTHYDAQLLWDPLLSVSPWHGVTSVVLGNCGFGVAPTRPAHHELIIRTLEKVEGMSAEALHAGLGATWPFESFPAYLDAVEAARPVINVAVLLGHTPLRLEVMGEAAVEREATDEELAAMRALVVEAASAGALGFASSKSPTHVGFRGVPVPSRAASTAEIIELAAASAEGGGRVVQATLGPGLLFAEFAEIARRTGRPVSWTALLAGIGGPGVDEWFRQESHALADQGLPVRPQASCRPLTFEFSFVEPFPFESSRLFTDLAAADLAGKRTIYADPAWRGAFREQMAGKGAGVLAGSWDTTVVGWSPADPSLEGRGVADLAAERGVDPTDLALDLALESDLAARFRMATVNIDEDRVQELLADPVTVLGLSDAGAHASQLCDACFSTHLLGHWVRERGSFSLEEAVRMLTSDPADVFGLSDRGLLAEGRPADVVVFDPATVGAGPLRRVADLPAGAERLVADAIGIDAVIVNGAVIRRDGVDVTPPAGRPGRLLRHGHAG